MPTYLHLLPVLKMCGTIPLYVLYVIMVCTGTAFHDLHILHIMQMYGVWEEVKNVDVISFFKCAIIFPLWA